MVQFQQKQFKTITLALEVSVSFLLKLCFFHTPVLSNPLPRAGGVSGHSGHDYIHRHSTVPLGQYNTYDYYTKPRYTYEYGVRDEYTGDMKSAQESRNGHVVKGSYQVLQPDGILRVVTYTSDPWRGFQAHVKMLNGHAHHPIPIHYNHQPMALGSNPAIHYQPIPDIINSSSNYNPQIDEVAESNQAIVTTYSPVVDVLGSVKPLLKPLRKKYKAIRHFSTIKPKLRPREFEKYT